MICSTPLNDIVLSPTRLRGEVDEAGIAKLARSIKVHGVIHPPIARLVGNKYELVTGERRFRGCGSLGMESMPLDVRELTDEEAAEIQLIENLQREDLTPLEEARGFVHLQESLGYSEKKIADRIGRAKSYVHARICLCDLCEAAEDAYTRNEISLGHANCLCRMQHDDQVYLLGRIEDLCLDVPGLKAVIASELVRALENAPFDCRGCLKVTTAQPDLFGRDAERGCLDSVCWEGKMTEYVAASAVGLRLSTVNKKTVDGVLGFREWAEVEDGDKPPESEQGIIVDGHRRGEEITVCQDRDWVREKRRPKPKAEKEAKRDPAGEFAVEVLEVSRIAERDTVEILWLKLVLPRMNKSHVKRARELVGVDSSDPRDWTDKEWMDVKLVLVSLAEDYPKKNRMLWDLAKSWGLS